MFSWEFHEIFKTIYVIEYNRKISGVVACTCNPGTLEAEFQNDVISVLTGVNNPLISG